MRIAFIGAHQKRQKILKYMRNYDKMRCRDELMFPAVRKGVH